MDLHKVPNEAWYKVYLDRDLDCGKTYTLRFSVQNCKTVPCLQRVSDSYLPDETVSGDVLLTYAYAQSTFTLQNKVLIALFFIIVYSFCCSVCMGESKGKRAVQRVVGILLMIFVLTWNYMYDSVDSENGDFSNFQADSETLVAGMIWAERDGISFVEDDEQGYGLGRYCNLKGVVDTYDMDYLTNDDWLEGYSRTDPELIVQNNCASWDGAATGNIVAFKNGEKFQIVDVKVWDGNFIIRLNADHVLTPAKYGSLDEISFYDPALQPINKSRIIAYRSQYGLQGRVFRKLARYMDAERTRDNLHLLCSITTAAVFVVITLLIAERYNRLMAGCFFVTFWLSPWVVNFARNLYWVEFTWFLPMALGLFCAWRIHDRRCRLLSYVLMFIAIFGKCLCGYEYISTVMMGAIAFLLADLLSSLYTGKRTQAVLLVRTIVIIGVIALLGFMAAVCVHATLRGNGSIVEGIKNIFEKDVLRRTAGGDMNEFNSVYWNSFNASVWEVLCRYFHFNTEIITGVSGNLFQLLCLLPLVIFACEYRKHGRVRDVRQPIMYMIFFLTSVSWYCLAKAHSYIHMHMNYVLWYFGYVQICIYTVVNKIIAVLAEKHNGASLLKPDGSYEKKEKRGREAFNAQLQFALEAKELARAEKNVGSGRVFIPETHHEG